MPDYRRHRVPGGCYFFTVNFLERRGNTLLDERIDVLRDAVRRVRRARPFIIDAWVVLPDHLHAVWTLPVGDDDFSTRWRMIKTFFAAWPAGDRTAFRRPTGGGRTRHLATSLLGAHDLRRCGLCGTRGLRAFQPG